MRWITYVMAMATIGACETQAPAAPHTVTPFPETAERRVRSSRNHLVAWRVDERYAYQRARLGRGILAATCRPFLWQNGSMVQLDSLLVPGFPDSLLSARDINDEGKITGDAFVRSTGKKLPFVATPVANR